VNPRARIGHQPMKTNHHKRRSTGQRRPAEGDEAEAEVPEASAGPRPFSAIELRQISTHVTTQWFLPVQGNRLTLLEVDPWRVHAYWTVAEADLAAARAALGASGPDAPLVLRFADLSPGAPEGAAPHPRFDVEVERARNSWYVGLWRDAKHYVAELGLRVPDGRFVALVRSNEVVTPRAGPSPELDFRHLEVRSPRLLPAQRPVGTASDTDRLLRDLFPKRVLIDDDYPLAVAQASAPLDEPPFPRLETAAPDPARDGWETPRAREQATAPGDASAGGFPEVDPAEIDPYRDAASAAKARLLEEIGVGLPPVAEETVSPAGAHLEAQPLPVPAVAGTRVAPAPDHPAGGPNAWWPDIPLEAVLAGVVSSPGQGSSPVQATVELVVRGHNRSPSPLTLCGERVPADVDGGFAVRLPVPRGTELAELLHRLCRQRGDEDGD
jgi:hypothetical protein